MQLGGEKKQCKSMLFQQKMTNKAIKHSGHQDELVANFLAVSASIKIKAVTTDKKLTFALD